MTMEPGAFIDEQMSIIRKACERRIERLGDAELEFFEQAVWPNDGRVLSVPQLETLIMDRLAESCFHFLRNYDRDALNEWSE